MNEYTAGATSVVEEVFIQDSASTTGAGKTGIVFNTASLTCYYKRSNGTASVAVTLVDITTLGTYVSGGFKAVDGTNMPGLYEFHPPDAAFATGAKSVTFYLVGASGMVARPMKFRILTVNPDSATAFMTSVATVTTVTNQLTAAQIATGIWQDSTSGDFTTASSIGKALYIANVAPGAAGGHFISGSNAGTTTMAAFTVTGAFTVNSIVPLDATISSRMATYTQPAGFLAATFPSGTIANTTNITAGTITTVTTLTNLPVAPTDWITATSFSAAAVTKVQNGIATTTNLNSVASDISSIITILGTPADESISNDIANAESAILTEGGPGPWTGGGGGGSLTTTQNALIQSGTEK